MYFSPLADIIPAEDTQLKFQNPRMNKNLKVNNILSEKKDDNIKPAINGTEDSKSIKYWLCTKRHRLMDCYNFKGMTIDERK